VKIAFELFSRIGKVETDHAKRKKEEENGDHARQKSYTVDDLFKSNTKPFYYRLQG
jgi:hypothetical protein